MKKSKLTRILWPVIVLIANVSWGQSSLSEKTIDIGGMFNQEVNHRLNPPLEEQIHYAQLLDKTFSDAHISVLLPQYVMMVDRNPKVQAALLFLRTPEATWKWIGATPISTGRVGTFNHFETPTGVFLHTPKNRDFKAEGTFNKNHIQGYGVRGMRVFDFGWVVAKRGWGKGGKSKMRLQMHATDPHRLEPKLGKAASLGCIRIPSDLNQFLDHHGILDAEYHSIVKSGETPVEQSNLAGRYLVVVDSLASVRPAWSPLPTPVRHQPLAALLARR